MLRLLISLLILGGHAYNAFAPQQPSRSSAPLVLASTTTTTTTTEESSSISSIAENSNNIILYDGVCNFCNTWVDILLRIDVSKKFRFAPLQSPVGKSLLQQIGKDPDDISSVILIQKDNQGIQSYFAKSRCVLQVVSELGPIASIASKTALNVVPLGVRDDIYDMVAENRYNLMGKRQECRCSDPEFAERFLL